MDQGEVPEAPTGSQDVGEGEEKEKDLMEDSDSEEMVEPEVNEHLLSQMTDMGFPRNRALRALYFTDADAVDQAISWLTENEDEPDLDDPFLVKKKKKMTPEEMKEHLEGLRLAAKAKREKEEKELEVHRERERIRCGREMMAAKRSEEDNARKRFIEQKKREKDEEKAAREKVRLRIEEDRKERRRKLGLPEEPTEEEKRRKKELEDQQAQEKANKSGMGVRNVAKPVGQLEVLRRRMLDMKKSSSGDAFKEASNLLLRYIGNIVRQPKENKFRKIPLGNKTFVAKVAAVEGAVDFLEGCGFESDEAGEFLVMKEENVDVDLLNGAGSTINNALSNPYFGVL